MKNSFIKIINNKRSTNTKGKVENVTEERIRV